MYKYPQVNKMKTTGWQIGVIRKIPFTKSFVAIFSGYFEWQRKKLVSEYGLPVISTRVKQH